ncbi:MAG: FHA domain-containing protein [Luteitalea sp.]|nr:FHA domain-containing protein [Luteitalea sp.]
MLLTFVMKGRGRVIVRGQDTRMRYIFGDCVVDTETRQARRAGEAVQLSPKGFDLLVMLIDAGPRAVRKLDLIRQIWPDANVTESSLSTLIAEIRRALGDPADDPRYIRTLHRYGYACIAQVTKAPSALATRAVPAAPSFRLAWDGGVAYLGPGAHVIGRAENLAVCLDHQGVSRRHARVTVAGGVASLEDVGSRNGTYVNGARVTCVVQLRDGDRIRVGAVELAFEDVYGMTVSIDAVTSDE